MMPNLFDMSAGKRALLDRIRSGAALTRSGTEPSRIRHAESILAAEHILGPGDRHNLSIVYDVDGAIDRARLTEAVTSLTKAHPILASRVLVGKDGPYTQPCASAGLVDLPADDAGATEAFARAQFDLTGPLLRVGLQVFGSGARIVLALHHLIADAQSLAIAARGLSESYNGRPPERPRPPVGIKPPKDLIAHFKARLGDALPPLELPLPDAPVAGGSPNITDYKAVVPQALLSKDREHAADMTEFETVFASAALALGTLTDAEAVTICVASDTRQVGEEACIGCYANLVPVRVAIDETATLDALADRIAADLRADLGRRDCTFAEIARTVGPGPARSLAEAVLTFRPQEPPELIFGSFTAKPRVIDPLQPQFSLLFDLSPHGLQWTLNVRCDAARTNPRTPARLYDFTVGFMSALARKPDDSVRDAQTTILRVHAPDPDRDEPGFIEPAPQLEALLAAEPSKGALILCAGETIDRARFKRSVAAARAAISSHLMAHPGRIGLSAHRCLDLPIWLMALLCEGASFVVIDPESPPADMKERCNAAALKGFCGGGFEDLPRLAFDPDADAAQAPPKAVDVGAEAYAFFTSGSTGRPKLVRVSRAALANLLVGVAQATGFGPGDSILSATSPTFDIALLELLAPLVFGGRLELADTQTANDAFKLAKHLAAARPTVFQSTPSLLKALAAAGWAGGSVTQIWSGGEALHPDLARRLTAERVYNFYGPTETTIWSAGGLIYDDLIHVGPPLAGQRIYILNRRGVPRPDGLTGEIAIGGRGVALGYDRDRERTAAAFRPDPVAPERGRIYLTGDRGRRLPDGRLVVHGRNDDQVKIRGMRIELGDVDARLCALPGVTAAAAWVCETPDGAQLHAAIVTERPLKGGWLERKMSHTLPRALIPSRLFAVDALPVSTNGKLDRNALSDLSVRARMEPPAPLEAEPETARVLNAFEYVTGLTSLRADDDFFLHGGDSVAMVRVLAMLSEQTGVTLSAMDMLERGRTARTLAQLVSERICTADVAEEILSEIERLSSTQISDSLKQKVNPKDG